MCIRDRVHTVYWNHEARVYVYKVTKRLAKPVVKARPVGSRVVVNAAGFVANSPLTLSYHGVVIARVRTDAMGNATAAIPTPDPGQFQYHLIVNDDEGNSASTTGLPSARLLYAVDKGLVRVFGFGFQPRGSVFLTYGGKPRGIARVRADGSFVQTFQLPADTHARDRIRASDQAGHTAWATGLRAPSIAFVASGHSALITGANYLPGSKVLVTYHGRVVGRPQTDNLGAFEMKLDLPLWTKPAYRLIGVDSIGRQASVTGLERR